VLLLKQLAIVKRRLIGGSDSLGSADPPPRQPRASPARPRL